MKTIQYTLFILLAFLFTACGDNTLKSIVSDVKSIQINKNNLRIYSTDTSQQLSASVTYNDGSSEPINNTDIWSNSDYSVLNMYDGEISASGNGGSSLVSINVGKFSDEINVSIIKLTDYNISNADINTTGEHTLQAIGLFEDNTSKIISKNITWSANNGATFSTNDEYVTTITILSGDTNVTATLFGEKNTSKPLAPITKTYSIN